MEKIKYQCFFADTKFILVCHENIIRKLSHYFGVYLLISPCLEINLLCNHIIIDFCLPDSILYSNEIIIHGEKRAFMRNLGSSILIKDPEYKIQYKIEPPYYYICLTETLISDEVHQEIFRFIRNLVVDVFSKLHKLHGAVLCYNNQAFCILGDKGAGKSTTSLRLLYNVPGMKFISNDKFLYDQGSETIYGIPSAISLFSDSIHNYFKNLEDKHDFIISDKKYFFINNIIDSSSILSNSKLKFCFFIVDPSCFNKKISKMYEHQLISRSVINFSDKMSGVWLRNLLNIKKNKLSNLNKKITYLFLEKNLDKSDDKLIEHVMNFIR